MSGIFDAFHGLIATAWNLALLVVFLGLLLGTILLGLVLAGALGYCVVRLVVKRPLPNGVVWASIIFGIITTYYSVQLAALMLVGVLLLAVALKLKAVWATAVEEIVRPALAGIICLAVFVASLNAVHSWADPEWVGRLEHTTVALRLSLYERLHLNYLLYVFILIAVVGISYLVPKLKVLDRFLFLKKTLTRTYIALAAATSFTLFAPLGVAGWTSGYAVELHLRDERARQTERLSLAKISLLESLPDPEDLASLVRVMTAEADRYHKELHTYSRAIGRSVALSESHGPQSNPWAEAASRSAPVEPPREAPAEGSPHTADLDLADIDLGDYAREVAEREFAAAEATALAEQKVAEVKSDFRKGLTNVLGSSAAELAPQYEGVFGAFIEELLETYASRFEEYLEPARRWVERVKLPEALSKLKSYTTEFVKSKRNYLIDFIGSYLRGGDGAGAKAEGAQPTEQLNDSLAAAYKRRPGEREVRPKMVKSDSEIKAASEERAGLWRTRVLRFFTAVYVKLGSIFDSVSMEGPKKKKDCNCR